MLKLRFLLYIYIIKIGNYINFKKYVYFIQDTWTHSTFRTSCFEIPRFSRRKLTYLNSLKPEIQRRINRRDVNYDVKYTPSHTRTRYSLFPFSLSLSLFLCLSCLSLILSGADAPGGAISIFSPAAPEGAK